MNPSSMNVVISTLHVRPRYNPSQETYVSGLLNGMRTCRPDGMKISVLVTHENMELFELDGFDIIVCPFIESTWRRMAWEQRALPVLMKKIEADIYHGTGNMALLRHPGPQVVTVHLAVEFRASGGVCHTLKVMSRRRIIDKSIRAASGVICASGYLRDGLLRIHKIPDSLQDKFRVIPMGVDSSVFHPNPENNSEDAAALEKLGVRKPYLFAYADVLGLKNVPRILKAWAAAHARDASFRDCSLALMGDPASMRFLEKNLAALGELREKVVFTGFVNREQLAALYRGARALVFPSLAESFGLCILEAMACGAPVLTSNMTAMPEVAGGAALLVDPNDIDQITQGMMSLYHDGEERGKQIDSGKHRAEAMSWENTAARTLDLYSEIAANRGDNR